MGIGTEFEAAKLPRHNARNVTDLHPDFGAIGDDLLFEDLELLQRNIKEIARTAGRIEHRHARQPVEKASFEHVGFRDGLAALGWRKRADVGSGRFFHAACPELRHGDQLPTFRDESFAGSTLLLALPDEEFSLVDQGLAFGQEVGCFDFGGLLLAGGEEVQDDRPHVGPFSAQRRQHDRLDEGLDILAARVVGAELGAFGRIEPALEKGTENRRVHGVPFELGGLVDGVDLVGREFQRGRVGKQVAFEVADFIDAERTAMGHALKQRAHHLLQDRRLIAMPDDHLGEKLRRQKSDVLGEEAEDHPVEKLGHRMRIETTLPQALRDVAETGCGLFSNRAVGGAWSELVRLKEKAPQHLETADRADLAQCNPMHLRRSIGEINMDFQVAGIARDEQRRIVERLTVLQELFVSLGEVGPSALVFESEEAALPHIGPTSAAALLGGAFFEGEGLASSIQFGGRGVADQIAEIEKVLLVGGSLGKISSRPFDNEFGRRHSTAMPAEESFCGKG